MSIYIINECTDPRFNLALEEYALKGLDFDGNCIILWQNRPSIIIGRHQNTLEEINLDYVNEKGIFVVRRMSGGGAVYHDLGNLNFTFIIKDVENTLYDFKRYTLPVIEALKKMGVKAEFNSRNDLTIGGSKFSGNAQHIYKNKLLHHGAILFDTDLNVLQNALKVSADKIISKGIKSVRSRVTNISQHLPEPATIKQFRDLLLKCLIESETDIKEYILNEKDVDAVETLKRDKYSTWEWNFGESPSFNFKNSKRFGGGKVEVFLDVKRGGIIKSCRIFGDFLGAYDISPVEDILKNIRYDYESMKNALSSTDINRYFGNISLEEILSCFF